MILLEPERTAFDLRWQMFGIPVRVHPMFWLFSAVLGWSSTALGFQYLLLWIGCVFISILVHELGHVFVGRAFGSNGHIVLYSFGGLAIGSNDLRQRWQRIAVLLAGPFAGFLFLGVVLLGVLCVDPERVRALVEDVKSWLGMPFDVEVLVKKFLRPTLGQRAMDDLVWINLLWGLMNLMPIWPLDGGQISRELLTRWSPSRGVRWSLGISLGTAAVLAVQSLAATYDKSPLPFPSGLYTALFFGMLALSSFYTMQQSPARDRQEKLDEPAPWERDPDWWRR